MTPPRTPDLPGARGPSARSRPLASRAPVRQANRDRSLVEEDHRRAKGSPGGDPRTRNAAGHPPVRGATRAPRPTPKVDAERLDSDYDLQPALQKRSAARNSSTPPPRKPQ